MFKPCFVLNLNFKSVLIVSVKSEYMNPGQEIWRYRRHDWNNYQNRFVRQPRVGFVSNGFVDTPANISVHPSGDEIDDALAFEDNVEGSNSDADDLGDAGTSISVVPEAADTVDKEYDINIESSNTEVGGQYFRILPS